MASKDGPLTGTWTRLLTTECFPRSSHVVSAIGPVAVLFGGEKGPREVVDNHTHLLKLEPGTCMSSAGQLVSGTVTLTR
jgi:hypothetical protein